MIKSRQTSARGIIGGIPLGDNLQNLIEERNFLRLIFPNLAAANFDQKYFNRIQLGEVVLPLGATAWMIMPDWRKISEECYAEALRRAFSFMQPLFGKFFFNRDGHDNDNGQIINYFRLRQSQRTVHAFASIAAAQAGHDFYIVPIKFASPSWVNSYNEVPHNKFAPNEFGPGVLMSAIFMLMNDVDYGSGLYFDCPGDEYWADISSTFSNFKPPFLFLQGKAVYFYPIKEGTPDLGGNYFYLTAYFNSFSAT